MITGFIKFLGPYYMLLITKRRKIGTICGHAVYSIAKSEMIPIPNSTVQSNMAFSKNENRSFANYTCKNVSMLLHEDRTKIEYAFLRLFMLVICHKCRCSFLLFNVGLCYSIFSHYYSAQVVSVIFRDTPFCV